MLRRRACRQELYVRLPLVGDFQVENALVAAGLAIATGGDPAAVFAALGKSQRRQGRLELVGDKPRRADLRRLRPQARCAGQGARGAAALCDRPAGRRVRRRRRPRPRQAAADGRDRRGKADRVIVTDDNPRSEDPPRSAPRSWRRAAAPSRSATGARRSAAAVAELAPGDVLLIAGKGHETGQIVGDRTLPFSDHEAVAAALKEKAA